MRAIHRFYNRSLRSGNTHFLSVHCLKAKWFGFGCPWSQLRWDHFEFQSTVNYELFTWTGLHIEVITDCSISFCSSYLCVHPLIAATKKPKRNTARTCSIYCEVVVQWTLCSLLVILTPNRNSKFEGSFLFRLVAVTTMIFSSKFGPTIGCFLSCHLKRHRLTWCPPLSCQTSTQHDHAVIGHRAARIHRGLSILVIHNCGFKSCFESRLLSFSPKLWFH